MSAFARLLVWILAVAACANSSLGSIGQVDARQVSASKLPSDEHPPVCKATSEQQPAYGPSEMRRGRSGWSRRDSLLDWLSYFATWLPCLALCLLSLCINRSSADDAVRYLPEGNGNIPVTDPLQYPRIPLLDCDHTGSVFYTYRPNLFGIEVPDEWDFYNLINTDRPDFTDATYSVGRGVTIIETGYTFRRLIDSESSVRQSRRSLPEALVRCGITDEFELRLKWNGYVMSDLHDLSSGLRQQIFGGDDLLLSIKYELAQQNGLSPMVTMLTGSTVPTGTNGISSNALQPFVNFVGGWGFRRWLYLKVSTGIDWQKTSISTLFGGGSEPTGPIVVFLRDNIDVYHYSASLLYQALPRVGGFVEVFGFGQTGGTDNRGSCFFDTGLYLYATTNVQFDVRFGTRLSNRVDELFTGAGLSVRY